MNTSIALLITTMVMALGAITFSSLTMAFERSYHRKSVRPFCNIHQNVTNKKLCISIENAGMGPMLIQSILLLDHHDAPIQTGVPVTKDRFSKFNCDITIPNTDQYVLASLRILNLVQCVADSSDAEVLAQLKETLNGCCLYVKYADIYDDIYEVNAILAL